MNVYNSFEIFQHFCIMRLEDFYFGERFVSHFIFVVLFGSYDKGAYLFLASYIMKTHGAKQQRDALKSAPKAQLKPVFEVRRYCFFTYFKWVKQIQFLISVVFDGRLLGPGYAWKY